MPNTTALPALTLRSRIETPPSSASPGPRRRRRPDFLRRNSAVESPPLDFRRRISASSATPAAPRSSASIPPSRAAAMAAQSAERRQGAAAERGKAPPPRLRPPHRHAARTRCCGLRDPTPSDFVGRSAATPRAYGFFFPLVAGGLWPFSSPTTKPTRRGPRRPEQGAGIFANNLVFPHRFRFLAAQQCTPSGTGASSLSVLGPLRVGDLDKL